MCERTAEANGQTNDPCPHITERPSTLNTISRAARSVSTETQAVCSTFHCTCAMQSTTQLCSPHPMLHCAMIEAITPESITDGVSTEELDENLCSTVSPGLSDELIDQGLCKPQNRLSSAIRDYSSPATALSSHSLDKNNGEQMQNLVKVRVGFDVTRKGERSLVIDGYKFTKSRDGVGGRVFWRCSRRECKATAVTVADRVEHIRVLHSHQPPVAAEFFAENSARSEQEVRFNNNVTTPCPRSRVRRRSQPNPRPPNVDLGEASKEPLTATRPTNYTPLSVETPGCRHSPEVSNAKFFEQVSPETTPNQPSNVSVNGFAAQTLTALITHLVESNSGTVSLKTLTSSREQNEVEFMSISPTGQAIKPGFCETKSSTQYPVVTDYANDRSPPPSDKAQTTASRETVQPNTSGTSSLEQLAAIASSFANSTSSSGSTAFTGHPPQTSSSLVFYNGTGAINTTSPAPGSIELVVASNANRRQFDGPQTKFVSAADMLITPDTVGFIGKNAQGQLVVLTGEQLSDVFRAQQLQRNADLTIFVSPDNSSTSANMSSTSPVTVTYAPLSMVHGQHASHESRSGTVCSDLGESRCNPTGPKDFRASGCHPLVARSSTDEQNTTSLLFSRLNELPNSLSCMTSLTGKTSESVIRPIVVTALQVQSSGSPINRTPVADAFDSSTYYSPSSTRRHSMLAEIPQHASTDVNSITECTTLDSGNASLNPAHSSGAPPPAPGKMPVPSLLIHWKKEKMRESVEEEEEDEDEEDIPPYRQHVDDQSSFDVVQHFNEANNQYSTHPCLMGERRKRHTSMGLFDEGSPPTKMPCCCDDVGQTVVSSSNSCSQYNSYHSCSNEMPTRPAQPQHCLTVSTGFDEEETLCNQVQDGILVKVLNTVQQLTAKLDADADPPEVIQNCRAIQACLDTIAAIRRVRSASGSTSGSPMCNNNNNSSADRPQTGKQQIACSESVADPNSVSSRSCMSDVSVSCQNSLVRSLTSDSTQYMLPV